MLQRTLHAAGIASGVTLGLMLLMSALSSPHPIEAHDGRDRLELDWIRHIEETPVRPDPVRPERIDRPPVTPPTPSQRSDVDWDAVTVPGLGAPLPTTTLVSTGPSVADGPLVSILRSQPNYPARAIAADLEGYVIVEFSVMPDGTTANHRVVESSHAVFEAAAIRAAERFRYKPRVIDGLAKASHGIQNIFRFELEKG